MTRSILIITILLIASCTKRDKSNFYGNPDWVVDPYVISEGKHEIAAVGIAQKSSDVSMQIAQAEADARANLASQIKTDISRLTKDAVRSANIKDVTDSERFFSHITQSIVKDLPLSGSKRTHIWINNETGTMFIRMVADIDRVAPYIKKSASLYGNELLSHGTSKEKVGVFKEKFTSEYLHEDGKSAAITNKDSEQ